MSAPPLLASAVHRDLIAGLSPDPVRAGVAAPEEWEPWIAALAPGYLWPPYAPYHAEFWEWVWKIEDGVPAQTFVAIWPRGYAKSSSVEVAIAALAARRKRRYALYVSAIQDQADGHVQNVAKLLESEAFARHYPESAQRSLGKYGNSDGWRRSRLRTASGFTVDAIGLDTAARGIKVSTELGSYRPDLLVLDDIDELFDAPGAVAKKQATITKSLLPARADSAAVLVAQNLVHADGIVARLANGTAGYLTNRLVSGPHRAIDDLVTTQVGARAVIVGGESTWPAKSLDDLQVDMDDIGLSAFLAEKQHEVDVFEHGIFAHVVFRHCLPADAPRLYDDIQVWVDPAVTDTDKSDSHGIQADGRKGGAIYRIFSWEARTSPEDALRRAILKALELGASCVGVETDQGGETWRSTYENTWRKLVDAGEVGPEAMMPPFRQEKAGSVGGKAERAQRMLAAYERGEIVHVAGPTTATLETALRRYLLRKPYDLVDAAFWAWYGLTGRQAPVVGPAGDVRPSRWDFEARYDYPGDWDAPLPPPPGAPAPPRYGISSPDNPAPVFG